MPPPVKKRRYSYGAGDIGEEDNVPIHNIIIPVATAIGSSLLSRSAATTQLVTVQQAEELGRRASTTSANGECPPGYSIARDSCTGELYCKKTRRRRKRLLTCGDKADIAFITGTLGKGQLAQSAITALLAKCG